MNESILNSIKKMLGGIDPEDTFFDSEIIIAINSALASLTQVGLGPSKGFCISDSTSTWYDLIGEIHNIEWVKSFVYIKTKLLFDPPLSSTVLDMMEHQANEFLWRIQVSLSTEQEDNQNEE